MTKMGASQKYNQIHSGTVNIYISLSNSPADTIYYIFASFKISVDGIVA